MAKKSSSPTKDKTPKAAADKKIKSAAPLPKVNGDLYRQVLNASAGIVRLAPTWVP